MNKETKQKSKKVWDVVSFTAVFLFFICSLICLIARLNGARFDLFGNRYDVVLTDSMSFKNEEHLDFLENDNNQFNAFDLAISKPLPAPDQIKEHDVVIYTDRYIGTNMHRVVEINENYCERVDFSKSTVTKYNDISGVMLTNVSSNIVTNDIKFQTLTLTTYSTLENVDNFNFFAMVELFEPEITRVPVNDIYGGYITTYKIVRNTTAPGVLKISHKSVYQYEKEIITSLKINSLNGTINVDPSSLLRDEESQNLYKKYNCDFSYKTRGDAAKNDDGWYRYSELQAIVVGNAPKMGYPIRFLGSIWGGIMFALLGFLILAFDIIATRMDKKEAISNGRDISKVEETKKADDSKLKEPIKSSNDQPKCQEKAQKTSAQKSVTTQPQKITQSQQKQPQKVLQTHILVQKQPEEKLKPGTKIVVSPVTGKKIIVEDVTDDEGGKK